MRNRVKASRAIIYAILAAAIGLAIGILIAPTTHPLFSNYNSKHDFNTYKLNEVLNIIKAEYVEEINADSLLDDGIQALLETLDPHSSYFNKTDMVGKSNEIQGNFEGIGSVLFSYNDTVCIRNVIPNSPSETAGLHAGDKIIKVDNVNIAADKTAIEDAIKLIRGRRHTTVTLSIKRHGEEGMRQVKVVRDVIMTPSIDYFDMLDTETGYIQLHSFTATSYKEFCNAVQSLRDKGLKKLIIDLRGNGGGLLDAACNIADELLPGNELIVYTEGVHQKREEIRSHTGGLFPKGQLMILIDENSASASEVLSGAIQDNDRGIIVGRRSFGKGLVQRQFLLSDGSAIWLTTARYYTPSGRCIQRPYDKGTAAYYAEYLDQMLGSSMNDTTNTTITDSTKYYTQQGRVVYGGGGIFPDKIINYKTDKLLVYYNQLFQKDLLRKFAFKTVIEQGQLIKKSYPTSKQFEERYSVSDKMFEQFVKYAEEQGIERDNASLQAYGEEMKTLMKAYISESLYETSSFYRIYNRNDNDLQEAIQYFKQQSNRNTIQTHK